jgi:hypothetical protein
MDEITVHKVDIAQKITQNENSNNDFNQVNYFTTILLSLKIFAKLQKVSYWHFHQFYDV